MKFKEFKFIPLEQLCVSNKNIRKSNVERERAELIRCLKKQEIQDALVVYYNEDEQKYEVVKGQRRFLAAQQLQKEGFKISLLPCLVKEGTDVEAIQESLLDELMRVAVDQNDTGEAILKLIDHYGDLAKVAEILGVNQDWLEFYVQHLNLNKPAPALEPEAPESKREPTITFKEDERAIGEGKQTELGPEPFSHLSLEERKEAERIVKDDPSMSPVIAASKAREKISSTVEVTARLAINKFNSINQFARDTNTTSRFLLDVWLDEIVTKKLKEKSYL